MTCQEFTDFLMKYLNGDLSRTVYARFVKHLAECPDCVAYLATYRETIRLGKEACAAGDASIPADVPEELVRAVLAALRR